METMLGASPCAAAAFRLVSCRTELRHLYYTPCQEMSTERKFFRWPEPQSRATHKSHDQIQITSLNSPLKKLLSPQSSKPYHDEKPLKLSQGFF